LKGEVYVMGDVVKCGVNLKKRIERLSYALREPVYLRGGISRRGLKV